MNRSLLYFFIVTLLILTVGTLYAQDFPMPHYTIEDGLPSNNVYDIYRDSEGFLWISTDKGLVRYNGLKFETFTTFNGLPDNEIFFTQEDNLGRIWFSTYNGELCYYKNDTFHTALNTPFLKLPFKTSFIKGITIENDSSITIFFMEDLRFINIKNEKVVLYAVDRKDASASNNIVSIKKLSDIGYRIYFKDRLIFVNDKCKLTASGKDLDVLDVFLKTQGAEYMYNEKGIYSADQKLLGQFPANFLKKYTINRILYNGTNEFISTTTGLLYNDSVTILKGNNVSCINQDAVGNYWISTLNNGIYKMDEHFMSTKLHKQVYQGEVKYGCIKNGFLFFTASNDDLYYLKNNKAICLFDNSDSKPDKLVYDQPAYFLDNGYNYYIFSNKEHKVVHNVFAPKKNIDEYANVILAGVKSVFSVNGEVYFQNRRRIRKIDYSRLRNWMELEGAVFTIGDSILSNRIFGVAQDADSVIWYSTLGHVYKIVNDSAVLQPQFSSISFKSFGFFGKYLLGYTQTNRLLVCSNYKSEIIIDSIPPQNCIWERLFQLDSSHVLITTNNLYRVVTLFPSGSGRKFSISTIENPFIPLHVEAIVPDSTNCYFLKGGDITSINIKSLLGIATPPKLYFTLFKTGRRSYPIDNEIEIPFRESRNITISFSRLLFDGREITQQYSISKNGQDNWRNVRGEEIDLISPGYGDYVIKIRAKSISSDYCAPVVFTLIIARPYWATWWFVLLLTCTAITAVVVVTRFRISYLLRKSEKEHATEVKFIKSEYKALNALMNPHFIFNTLNNVQGLVNRNDKLAANEYLRVFADLIRQNMHNISKELIPLQKEVDLVNNYLLLEKLRFKEFLNYEINIDEGIDLSEIMVPPLLVQPLVENSIKHGILPLESADSFVHINVYERKNVLHIEVKDNGVGMAGSKNKTAGALHESFGMDNIRKRIEQLSIIQNKEIGFHIGEITDDTGKLQWTVVTITMPIS